MSYEENLDSYRREEILDVIDKNLQRPKDNHIELSGSQMQ